MPQPFNQKTQVPSQLTRGLEPVASDRKASSSTLKPICYTPLWFPNAEALFALHFTLEMAPKGP